MSIIARNSITVSIERDIEAVYRFYKLQASTASEPAKPTVNAVPPSGWSKTEPSYTEGSTNSLYMVDLTVFTDGTFSYSDVSLSSSYEAAKAAYNKAVTAGNTADQAQTRANAKNAVFYQDTAPSTTGRKQYDIWFDTAHDNKMYYWDGTTWTPKQFGTGAITNSAITTDLLAASSVTADKIVSRAITAAKIATGAITANEIAANTITAANIASHTITAGEITTDNIVGSNGWINLAQGTFNYGNKLIWNGTQLSVNGRVSASSGSIAGFDIESEAITTTGLTIHKGIPATTEYEEEDPVTGEITHVIDVNYDQEPGYIVMEGYSNAYDIIISQRYKFTYNGFGITAEVNDVKTLQISREEIDLFGVSQTQRQKVAVFEKRRETEAAWRTIDYGKLSLYSFVWDGQEDPVPTDDPVHSIILDALDGSIDASGTISADTFRENGTALADRYLQISSDGSYWGVSLANTGSGDKTYLRSPSAGLIPYASSNTSRLGTSGWPWYEIYGKSIHVQSNLDFHTGAAGNGIRFVGTQATYTLIRFMDNTSDTYGQGIAIGGGGSTIIGGGESAATIVGTPASIPTAAGQEIMVIANDGNIDFYANVQNGVASAKHFWMDTNGDFKGTRYLYASYLNQSSSAETPTTSSYLMYCNSDGFLRKSTLANIKTILGLGSAAYTASTAYAAASHTHTLASLGAAASNHTHTPASIGAAAASHTHSYMAVNPSIMELYPPATTSNYGGAIDFHYNRSSADYTSRIIENASGQIYVVAKLLGKIWSGHARVMVGSDDDDGNRVAAIKCNSATQVGMYAQWKTTGSTYKYMYWTASSSDPRLKKNIRPSTVDALDIINRLPLYQFDWRADEKHWKAGFIAPEIYEIEPELTIKPANEDEEYWGIDDFYLLGILTKAVQELSQQNKELKSRVSSLEQILF